MSTKHIHNGAREALVCVLGTWIIIRLLSLPIIMCTPRLWETPHIRPISARTSSVMYRRIRSARVGGVMSMQHLSKRKIACINVMCNVLCTYQGVKLSYNLSNNKLPS
jgi:hypothetical protein